MFAAADIWRFASSYFMMWIFAQALPASFISIINLEGLGEVALAVHVLYTDISVAAHTSPTCTRLSLASPHHLHIPPD